MGTLGIGSLFAAALSSAAPLDPPQVAIRATYKNSGGSTTTYPEQVRTANSGTVNLSATTLFGSAGVPRFTGGAIATISLFGRTESTAAYTSLDTANLASWLPSVAMRWQAEWYGQIEQDKLAFSFGNDQALVKGVNGLNVSGALNTVSPGIYRVRADQRLGFAIAGARGPGHSLVTSTDPLRDQVVVERYWQSYDRNTWALTGSVLQKRVLSSNSRNFAMLRLGRNNIPQGLDISSGGVNMAANPDAVVLTFNESGGSDPTVIAGRETIVFRLAPFLPDNASGLELGRVEYNVWPQTVAAVTPPPVNVMPRDGAGRLRVSNTAWSLPVSTTNVYPGAEIYARVVKSGGSYDQLVTSFAVPVTNINSPPISPSGTIPGAELMPAISNADGVYNLRVYQRVPGRPAEVLVDFEYVVETNLRVEAVIGEIAK